MKIKYGFIIGLIVVTLLITIPISPLFLKVPFRDQGQFLYSGWLILHGQLPYKDIWDHKPPLIDYLNALAILIDHKTGWGIWTINYAAILSSASLLIVLLKKRMRLISLIVSITIFFTAMVFLLQGGNYAEEFAVPLQLAAVYLVFWIIEKRRSDRYFILVGILAAGCFFLKQNLIGIFIAITVGIYFLSGKKCFVKKIFFSTVGFFMISLIISSYFYLRGGWLDFVDCLFMFNYYYSQTTLSARIAAIARGSSIFSINGAVWLAGLMWLYTVKNVISGQRRQPIDYLLFIAIIDFPIEWILSTISGRAYFQYYFPLLFPITVLSAYGIEKVIKTVKWRSILYAVIVIWIGYSWVLIGSKCIAAARYYVSYSRMREPIVQFIKKNTRPDDEVLVWGSQTMINYLSERISPTKYGYQYALYLRGYQNKQMVEEFYNSLLKNRPKMIVDTSATDATIPPLNEAKRQSWHSDRVDYQPLPEMQLVYNLVKQNYRPVHIFSNQWIVYQYHE